MSGTMAIQTEYAGHLFRSRLEARWAVFFDSMSMKWTYEPQGFIITCPYFSGNERYQEKRTGLLAQLEQAAGSEDEGHPLGERCPWHYLPDFHLPTLDMWVEVKGDDERFDWTMAGVATDGFSASGLPESKRARGSGGSSLLILGDIPRDPDWYHLEIVNQKGPAVYSFSFSDPSARDHELGIFDTTWNGCEGEVSWGRREPEPAPSVHGFPAQKAIVKYAVREAYKAARQARFEHGAAVR